MKYYKHLSLFDVQKLILRKNSFVEQHRTICGYNVRIYINGIKNNVKGPSFVDGAYKYYALNNIYIGTNTKFKTNKDWKRYVKLVAFI